MSDLKPCPWPTCGNSRLGPEHVILTGALGDKRCIRCGACGASGPVMKTEDEAVAAWNQRAPVTASELSDAVCLLACKAALDASPSDKALIKMWRIQAEGGIAEIGRMIREGVGND